jgi:hypothetical protein
VHKGAHSPTYHYRRESGDDSRGATTTWLHGATPLGLEPLSGRVVPESAHPQKGVSQLGIIIQTFDTGAVLNERGEMDFMNQIGVCEAGQNRVDNFCFGTEAEFDAFPGLVVDVPEGEPAKKYAYMDEHGNPTTPDIMVDEITFYRAKDQGAGGAEN